MLSSGLNTCKGPEVGMDLAGSRKNTRWMDWRAEWGVDGPGRRVGLQGHMGLVGSVRMGFTMKAKGNTGRYSDRNSCCYRERGTEVTCLRQGPPHGVFPSHHFPSPSQPPPAASGVMTPAVAQGSRLGCFPSTSPPPSSVSAQNRSHFLTLTSE